MRLTLITLLILLTLCIHPVVAKQSLGELDAQNRETVAEIIRAYGYQCHTVSAAFVLGHGPYGIETKVRCNTGKFQVITTPDGKFIVRTWKKRL